MVKAVCAHRVGVTGGLRAPHRGPRARARRRPARRRARVPMPVRCAPRAPSCFWICLLRVTWRLYYDTRGGREHMGAARGDDLSSISVKPKHTQPPGPDDSMTRITISDLAQATDRLSGLWTCSWRTGAPQQGAHRTLWPRTARSPCAPKHCHAAPMARWLPLASCAPASLGSLCGRVRAQGHVHRLRLVEASGGARREEEELARHEDAQRALGGGLGRDGRRGQREGEGGQR